MQKCFPLFSTVLGAQEHQCTQENNRRPLTFVLFPYCSPSPSPKPDGIAWGAPLQVNNPLSAWTVEGTMGWDAVLHTLLLCSTVSNHTHSNNPELFHLTTSAPFVQLCLPYAGQILHSLCRETGLKWFEDKIVSLYSALSPARLSCEEVREISNSCCQKHSLLMDK